MRGLGRTIVGLIAVGLLSAPVAAGGVQFSVRVGGGGYCPPPSYHHGGWGYVQPRVYVAPRPVYEHRSYYAPQRPRVVTHVSYSSGYVGRPSACGPIQSGYGGGVVWASSSSRPTVYSSYGATVYSGAPVAQYRPARYTTYQSNYGRRYERGCAPVRVYTNRPHYRR